jgi:hypothetical protein
VSAKHISIFFATERGEESLFNQFLGAFAKIRKATISFVMSVRLSVRTKQMGSRWTDFHEI